jgi:hypothetical protein
VAVGVLRGNKTIAEIGVANYVHTNQSSTWRVLLSDLTRDKRCPIPVPSNDKIKSKIDKLTEVNEIFTHAVP